MTLSPNKSFRYDAKGVELIPTANNKRLSARVSSFLTNNQVAALTDYEAHDLGLPSFMEATLVIAVEGRIDLPSFRVTYALEPFQQAHPWVMYARAGALIRIGDHLTRLNSGQLMVFEALDTMSAASDVPARLMAWQNLVDALHTPSLRHVLVATDLPHIRVTQLDQFPPDAMTRLGTRLTLASANATAAWAMQSGRRYFMRRPC